MSEYRPVVLPFMGDDDPPVDMGSKNVKHWRQQGTAPGDPDYTAEHPPKFFVETEAALAVPLSQRESYWINGSCWREGGCGRTVPPEEGAELRVRLLGKKKLPQWTAYVPPSPGKALPWFTGDHVWATVPDLTEANDDLLMSVQATAMTSVAGPSNTAARMVSLAALCGFDYEHPDFKDFLYGYLVGYHQHSFLEVSLGLAFIYDPKTERAAQRGATLDLFKLHRIIERLTDSTVCTHCLKMKDKFNVMKLKAEIWKKWHNLFLHRKDILEREDFVDHHTSTHARLYVDHFETMYDKFESFKKTGAFFVGEVDAGAAVPRWGEQRPRGESAFDGSTTPARFQGVRYQSRAVKHSTI